MDWRCARYKVRQSADGWQVHHDTDVSIPYVTRQAAFEAAISQANNAVRMGHAVIVSIASPSESSDVQGIG